MVHPLNHALVLLFGEPKKIPRARWIKILIKNSEAIFEWIKRFTQPLLESRMMWIIDLKASISDWIKFIDRIIPVIIWKTIKIPKKKPKFHINLIEGGVGRSNSGLITFFKFFILKRGLNRSFRKWTIIYYWEYEND